MRLFDVMVHDIGISFLSIGNIIMHHFFLLLVLRQNTLMLRFGDVCC